uniref:Endonuclease III homolog n=1 Tax=Ascaris suum TaxID=6253 RepID=F1L3X1_ASCSU
MKRRAKAIRIEYETNDAKNDRQPSCSSKLKRTGNSVKDDYERPLWERHLERLQQMRESKDAPVDTMGCHMLGDVLASPQVYRFQILVSLMLSSQTKDQITAAAMQRLRSRGCTVEGIIEMSELELQDLLIPVGFYKRKAIYLKKVADILSNKYGGDIPNTVEDLCSLPGVGPKMAHLAMQHAWGRIEGLGVDTHVHRIANRLGWVKTKTPEQTRVALEELIPKERWAGLNKLLVGFGQQTCLPTLPKCSDCLNKDICPAIGVHKKR